LKEISGHSGVVDPIPDTIVAEFVRPLMLLGMVPPTGTHRREQNARKEETVEEHDCLEVKNDVVLNG